MNTHRLLSCLTIVPALLLLNGLAAGQDEGRDLRLAFQDPPSEYRPVIITHGQTLTDPGVLAWLDARRAGGAVLDGGVKTAGGQGEERWNDPDYLNDPQVFERLREVIATLHDRGREVWIYDELGYPSASAGGRVLHGHPEYQVWAVGCRNFQSDDDRVEVNAQHHHVEACLALPRKDGVLSLHEAVDLTARARSGSFTWKTPAAGDWTVCLFERYQPDTWRRHNIPRRNVNIMDRDAVARFIEITHERYAQELGAQLADVTLFFTDEPQFGATEPWIFGKQEALPAVQWCDELPRAFKLKKGYEVAKVLPALFHDVGPETSRFRFDFYDVQSDLVAENYFGQIQKWCHEHGVWSSGHMLLEESLLFHVMWSGSMVKNWSRMDLPGVDLLQLPRYKTMGGWNGGTVKVKEDFSCKMAASIAHMTGKQGVFTESYAVAEDAKLRPVLGIAAWQFATGVTHMSTYTIQNQLSAEDYATFADFSGRLALLCRRGQAVSDVAVLVPEASVWAAYNPPAGGLFPRYLKLNPAAVRIDHVFRETCHQLLSHQRDFEILSEHLLQQATIREGRLELAGQRFGILILPEMRMLQEATLSKAQAFVEMGGHVAFVGSLPSQTSEHGDTKAVTQKARELLASARERTRHVAQLDDLGEMISWMAARVPPPVVWNGPSSVRIMCRHEPGRHIVLLANPSAEGAEGTLTATFTGEVSLWNPETGVVKNMDWRKSRQAVALLLPADSARFIVVEQGAAGPPHDLIGLHNLVKPLFCCHSLLRSGNCRVALADVKAYDVFKPSHL